MPYFQPAISIALAFALLLTFHCPYTTFAQESAANPKADSIAALINKASGPAKITLLEEAFALHFPTDLEEAHRVAVLAVRLSKADDDDEAYMRNLKNLGAVYNRKGQFDSLRTVAQDYLELAKKINSHEDISYAFANIAISYERIGSLDTALAYNQKALEHRAENEKFPIYNNLGRIYSQKGNLNQSIKNLELAMLGARAFGDRNAEAIIANNIGGQYQLIKNETRAIEYFNKSVAIKKEIGDKRGQLFGLFNLVNNSYYSIDQKRTMIGEALELAKEIDDKRFIGLFTAFYCSILIEVDSIAKSRELIVPVYQAAKADPAFEYSYILLSMIQLYLAEDQLELAEERATEYLTYAQNRKSLEEEQIAREQLLKIYDKKEDLQKYHTTAKVYYSLKDSLDTQLNLTQFAYLEAEIDEEQKAKIEILNQSVEQKTRARNRFAIFGGLIALLLISLLYFRNKLVKTQKLIIAKEKESSQQLEKMNAVLQEHAELRDRLYTNITHEFKTPLTVINGTIQQIEGHGSLQELAAKDGGIASKFGIIKRNGNNLLTLINQFLDLSKLEDKALELHQQSGNIVKYIQYLAESFESLFVEHRIAFELEAPDEEIVMDFDKEKIRHIITNLISNAIKHTPPGGEIKISVHQLLLNNHDAQLQIEVRDNGEGIPEESIANVFDRFYQVKGQKTQMSGTGIGLALCKELVQLMDGKISIKSKRGKGTSFKVQLPIANKLLDADVQNQGLAKHPSGPSGILENNDKPHILIVEDNKEVADFIASCIEKDYQYSVAQHGGEGIEMALGQIPDLIITDITMPVKDGFEVCEAIKNHELTSHVPIIMLTAKSTQESRLQGLEKGADDYLIKPFDTKELSLRIQNLLNNREAIRKHFTNSKGLKSTPQGISEIDKKFFNKVFGIVEENLTNEQLGVEFLAEKMNISPAHLNRKLKALTDLSTNKFILNQKLKHALSLLENKDANVSEVAFESGFNSVAYFVKCFREKYDETPGAYQKRIYL